MIGPKCRLPFPGQQSADEEHATIPIVAMGASAGGLEALESFLSHVPSESALAFVIIQHLAPDYEGMMVELLQRASSMPVSEIEDQMQVEPGHVYLIPPNHDLSILHGKLCLLEPSAPRGLRMPIDFFFSALADDQGAHCAGVILSGMGTDGSQGLRAIKEKGGATFVQSPDSAKFEGMPQSAIDTGFADVIAASEDLGARIQEEFERAPLDQEETAWELLDPGQVGVNKVIVLLRTQTRSDFSQYKKSTLYRRIERRMGLHLLSKIDDYVRLLQSNPQEANLLLKEFLIGVTSFFRDPEVWNQVRDEVIPKLLASHSEGATLRAWSAACSTGEEAFSLAIVYHEALEFYAPGQHYSLRIFATDLDSDAVDKARTGLYPATISDNVSKERLQRYFVRENDSYRVRPEIRDMVTFATQNLIMDPPFTRLDLVSCRNLLIYLTPQLQGKLLHLYHYSLNQAGFLLLGGSEALGQSARFFFPLPGKNRLYRRRDEPSRDRADGKEFPIGFYKTLSGTSVPSASPKKASLPLSLDSLTNELLARNYAPAAVLTTDNGDILYVSGKTGKFLEPAVGKANLNLFAMAREGLGLALNETFHKALRMTETVTLEAVIVGTGNASLAINLSVQPLIEPAELCGMVLVVFSEVVAPTRASNPEASDPSNSYEDRLTEFSLELERSRDQLQSTREEMQSSHEELKSTNEELQSVNEELQSSNEELTTSKEEMQSMNEELQTVNGDLQSKMNELGGIGDDLRNLLEANDIATLFLDAEIKIRRFTPGMVSIINLIPGDVGRPITDVVSALDYPALASDAMQVLKSQSPLERQAHSEDGRWFQVSVVPYRTLANVVAGVVITFVDISVVKALEGVLREAVSTLEARCSVQAHELGEAKDLEEVSKKAQFVLEELMLKQSKTLEAAQVKLRKSRK